MNDRRVRIGQGTRHRTGVVAAAIFVILTVLPAGFAAGPPERAADVDRREVEQAARAYLEAEARRDFEAVWALLAPSSDYCGTHDFRAYREEARRSPVRIERFEILRVGGIRPNHDPVRFPKVERFADVEVDLLLFYEDTGTRAEVNFLFTFIREGGRWYKG